LKEAENTSGIPIGPSAAIRSAPRVPAATVTQNALGAMAFICWPSLADDIVKTTAPTADGSIHIISPMRAATEYWPAAAVPTHRLTRRRSSR
jgi:hypothetical protein